jgi:hypothetical protein
MGKLIENPKIPLSKSVWYNADEICSILDITIQNFHYHLRDIKDTLGDSYVFYMKKEITGKQGRQMIYFHELLLFLLTVKTMRNNNYSRKNVRNMLKKLKGFYY